MNKLLNLTKLGGVFLLFLVFSLNVSAQVHVRGTVVDELGEPAIGATIQVKGTTHGTVTDLDGNFTISAPAGGTLVVSYVGYSMQEVPVSTVVNVTLRVDSELLDEIIVVAYGTASRAGFTGSASTVRSEAIERAQVSSVTRLLQGAASGVQSIASSGQPGSDANIFIRGIGSINASNSPLFIVDGAPFDGALNSINPADIESINILKDAASTALYGSRAGNGLVIITTKQGRRNERPVVDARFTYGVSGRAVRDYKQVNTDQYFEMVWEALRNQRMYVGGASATDAAQFATNGVVSRLQINPYGPSFSNPVGLDGRIVPGAVPLWDDNWSQAYTQDARRMEANVNIRGGGAASTYFVSLSYLDDVGIAPMSDFRRYSGRVNLNNDIRSWLRLSTNIALTHSIQNAPQGEDSNLNNALMFARLVPSFYPVWERNRETGALILDANGNRIPDFGPYRPSAAQPGWNHLGTASYNFNRVMRDVATARVALDIDLMKGLTYRTSVNIDYNNRNDHNYVNPEIGPGSSGTVKGSVGRNNIRTTGLTTNNVLTYQPSLEGLHSLRVLLGQEYYERNIVDMRGTRSGFPSLGFTQPSAASQLDNFTGIADQYKLLSYFGSVEYNFNHRYYGSASIRRDGSSRFSPKSRWGTFWALGGSWRISEEEFMQNADFVDNLSLRASYGGQGNDGLNELYAYKALFSIANNLGESGFVTNRMATPNLKWETNLNFNVGIDYSFFNRRLSGSIEYFDRRSKDLLFDVPRPTSIGYPSLPSNAGSMKNYGVELSVTGRIINTSDWRWDLTLNATHYRNKITSLPTELRNGFTSGTKRVAVGGSLHDWFMVEWGGVDPEDGLPQWWMTNGQGERVLTKTYSQANNDASKIITGTALPGLMGGVTSNLRFKHFDLSAMFAYSIGGKLFNQDKWQIQHTGASVGRAWSVEMLNRWTPENRDTDVPRLQSDAFAGGAWTNQSTRFLVDASYVRLKNLTLGYNIPSSILTPLHITSCRVFLAGENLFTIFGAEGMDPEQALNGVSYFRYPAMRTASVGVNITF
ncbi:MAG: TonB-dependent receptor [Dysgonamonadaceae bacterium]|jgi:TonB-linked SusC/RagA family outer membrane protein|nr:TonB-dependent receptor [Dysgonamonadaceae bacterium]